MSTSATAELIVNDIAYRWPEHPVVVVCVDGGDATYYESGLEDGILPNLKRFMSDGFSDIADGVVPSFTNPNNLSIVTGSPPSVHGISGNFFLDPDTGEEVMMNDPKFLRSETLFALFADAGAGVAVITAKDKLRLQLGHNLRGGICFSSEFAAHCTMAENGIEDVVGLVGMAQPEVYSAELSLFVMEAGIRLLERDRPDIMYLSLTDYIQHKYAPGTPVSNDFYARLDDTFGKLEALGAVVGLVADHGMNDKSRADDSPNVIYLQDLLDREFGAGAARVVLPITDPYVVHHGALGGYARIYCTGADPAAVIGFVTAIEGVERVYDKDGACRAFDLPPDREGDIAVISDAATAIGGAEAAHDLSGLEGHRLRSHGGVSERRVPFILSAPLNRTYAARAANGNIRSFEIFDYAINGTD